MASSLRTTLTLAPALVALTLVTAARPARACSPDECFFTDRWTTFELVHDVVAPDGVLVFHAVRGEGGALTDAEALAHVTVTLGDGDEPITGTLEVLAPWRAVIWRPDGPLPPGIELLGSLAVDNAGIDVYDGCADDLDVGLQLSVASQGLPPLTAPAFTTDEQLNVSPRVELDALVCCDGAYPYEEDLCGAPYVGWSVGSCASAAGIGRVTGLVTWPEGLPPEARADRSFGLVQLRAAPGQEQLGVSDTTPFCVTPTVMSFASGEEIEGAEVCFGDDVADMLGDVSLDPTDELAELCAGEPYTCAIIPDEDYVGANRWDEEDCAPWGGGGTESGTESGGTESGGTESGGTESGGTDGTSDTGEESGGSSTDAGTTAGTDSAGEDDSVGRGCGCTNGQAPHGAGLLLLGLAGLLRRRRAAGDDRVGCG
ncbi:MAG: hypothetical protein KC636_12995 [Myxococcales bacterium]|nr:hypothetical protein [Myxococcales bacterium]